MKKITLMAMVVLCTLMLIPNSVLAAQIPKGEVVYANPYPIFMNKGGDPATHAGGQGPILASTVFEGLVGCDVDLSTIPAVAERWTISPDRLSHDFYIKKGIKFHNGDPVTAEDVKFSMETHMRKELKMVVGNAYRKAIKSIEVIDTHHVRFHYNSPRPGIFKRYWWNGAIMPKKYREAVGDDGFADKPIGSGPFKYDSYKQDQWFRITAVENHHRKTPEIKSLKMIYVAEPSTRLAMLKAGEVDIAELKPAHIPVIKADPNLRLFQVKDVIGKAIEILDVGFDEPSPLKDIRVREAMSLAIDRKTITEKILFGSASPYGDVLSPVTLGSDPSIKPDPYDPERAKKLLKEAGYANGFSTTFSTVPRSKMMAEVLQASWADIGVKVKIDIFEQGAYFEAVQAKKFRGLRNRDVWYDAELHPGADMQDAIGSLSPWAIIKLPGLDEMIEASFYTKNDEETFKAGRAMSQSFRDNRWRIITWTLHDNYGLSKKIVEWKVQKASKPGTRFEFMKIRD